MKETVGNTVWEVIVWQLAVVALSWAGFVLVGISAADGGFSTSHLVIGGLMALSGGSGLLWLARTNVERLWQLLLFLAPTTAMVTTGITITAAEPVPVAAAVALLSMVLTGLVSIRVAMAACEVVSPPLVRPRTG